MGATHRVTGWAPSATGAAGVSCAYLAMAGVTALGLHLIGAAPHGHLVPMTAAVLALALGGSVTPSGRVEAFGVPSADATAVVQIAPLGVGLLGALLIGRAFARSLGRPTAELDGRRVLTRATAMLLSFLLLLTVASWIGTATVLLDADDLGLVPNRAADPDPGRSTARLTGLLLADGLRVPAHFSVDLFPTLLGGTVWLSAVLLITLLAHRQAPLPARWRAAVHGVRPAASAVCGVLVLAVLAGVLAAAVAAIRDDHPGLVIGSALLGAPNGVWLGVTLGLFVPWHGTANGVLRRALPDPLSDLLSPQSQTITLPRVTELDGRVWLLVVGCALMALTAGVLTATRTPAAGVPLLTFTGRCALRLALTTAVALPLLVASVQVTTEAHLVVLRFDLLGAGLRLRGAPGTAALLGAGWGTAAGAAGALLARVNGAAGRYARH